MEQKLIMDRVRRRILERRAYTDASLGAERETTTLLSFVRTQRAQDDLLERDRRRADAHLSRLRENADDLLARGRSTSPAKDRSADWERRAADESKRAEREATDALHVVERQGADDALATERRKHESDRGRLNECRQNTDDQLSTERFGADVAMTALGDAKSARARAQNADRAVRRRAARTVSETERQRRHGEKMAVVGRLAIGVAHDFNNMLCVILTTGDLLREQLEPASPLRPDVDAIRQAASQAAGLTRQLLRFTRPHLIEPEVIDLNDVIVGIDRLLRCALGAGVELTLTKGPIAPVLADPGNIEQAVMNLVVNARDAMPAGGKVTIETADVLLDEEYAQGHAGARSGRHVRLRVTDSGIGMDEATLARVFEPFFTTKEKGKGTGLGLSTVLGIVEQSGGSVCVSSQPGRTTFDVFLPCVDAALDDGDPSSIPPWGPR